MQLPVRQEAPRKVYRHQAKNQQYIEQHRPGGSHKDHQDKFSFLWPLQDREGETVTSELWPLFLIQGAPVVQKSDNGWEFVTKIIDEIRKTWIDCQIVHGSAWHPKSQGSAERANCEIEVMMLQWMNDHKIMKWSVGLPFVCHKKNNRYHEGNK
jgi:hypothetical protein